MQQYKHQQPCQNHAYRAYFKAETRAGRSPEQSESWVAKESAARGIPVDGEAEQAGANATGAAASSSAPSRPLTSTHQDHEEIGFTAELEELLDVQDRETHAMPMDAFPAPVPGNAAASAAHTDAIPSRDDGEDIFGDAGNDILDESEHVDPHANLKKRRLYPGAPETSNDFDVLFASYAADVQETLRPVAADPPIDDLSISAIQAKLQRTASTFNSDWDEDMVRIVTGALAVYRLRLVDMSQREHALLLWIIEGSKYLRAHNKQLYVYVPQGAFQPLKECPPESTFGRVKSYMLRLEGLFRLLPQGVAREDAALMGAIKDLRAGFDSTIKFFDRCTDASIFCLGNKKSSQSGARRGAQGDGPDDEDAAPAVPDPPMQWSQYTAESITKVAASMQKELSHTSLLACIARWCNSPVDKASGCVYADTTVLYDTSPGVHVKHVAKSPSNNIYTLVNHALADPHMEIAIQDIQLFYKQFFWCNNYVFLCHQAALALAKRGLNVDRLFFGISPGGVGQSLYSHLLHAMHEGSAAFFDPSVWTNEEELRKQIEQWAGCFILTGQESPDSSKRVRDDLFKKTVTGDPLAGRRPYGYVTVMMELIGWTRLECNKIIKFWSVSERNFYAVLRRSFCWEPKARFFDRTYLEERYPDAALDGIFPSDPTLKDKLRSGPCVAAALRLQHGFELKHGPEDCRNLIEGWASLGRDGGFTERTMRQACGLPHRALKAETTEAHAINAMAKPPSQPEGEGAPDEDPLDAILATIIHDLLRKNRNGLTPSMFAYLSLPAGFSSMSKDDLWGSRVQKGLLLEVKGEGKAKRIWMPLIKTHKKLHEVIPLQADADDLVFPETYDLQGFRRMLSGTSARDLNVQLLIDHVDDRVQGFRKGAGKGRGKMTRQNQTQFDELSGLARKLRRTEELAGRIIAEISPTPAPSQDLEEAASRADTPPGQSQQDGSPRPHKFRRLRAKSPSDPAPSSHNVIVGMSPLVAKQCRYNYPLGIEFRSRRQVEGVGAQSLPRCFLVSLVPHTIDLDVVNCCFTLSYQLIMKLEVVSTVPAEVLDAIRECAQERRNVCSEHLGVDESRGKSMLTSVFNGGSPPAGFEDNAFLKRLQKAARYMRWFACSVAPDVYSLVGDDPSRDFPTATTFTYVWNAVEDCILSAIIKYMKQYDPTHLSLHYDGVRVAGGLPRDIEVLCKNCSERVFEDTGFRIELKEKKHWDFMGLVQRLATSINDSDECPAVFTQRGNCIPGALRSVLGQNEAAEQHLRDDASEDNLRARERGHRAYGQCATMFGVQLSGSLGFCAKSPGKYLLHTEPSGRPHAVGLILHDDDRVASVFSDGREYKISLDALHQAAESAVDARMLCTFLVSGTDEPARADAANQGLLSLLAGASDGDCSDPDTDCDPDSLDCEAAEAVVSVGDTLLQKLHAEVCRTTRGSLSQYEAQLKRCPLCPFRCLSNWMHWHSHLATYHTERQQYCCSGTKQLRIAIALFDADRASCSEGDNYLKRSAGILRQQVETSVDTANNEVDRWIRLVFSADGPKFSHVSDVGADGALRRVRNRYYTKEFANMIYKEFLLHDSKV